MSCAALRCAALCHFGFRCLSLRSVVAYLSGRARRPLLHSLYSTLAVNVLSVGVTSDSILCLDCVYCCGLSAATLMGGFDGHLEPAAEVAKGQGIMSSVYYWSYVVIVVVLFLNIAVAILVDSYGTYAYQPT